MTILPTWFAQGSPTTDLTAEDLRAALVSVFERLEPRRKVLALPPDFTRANSMAGPLTCMTYDYFGPTAHRRDAGPGHARADARLADREDVSRPAEGTHPRARLAQRRGHHRRSAGGCRLPHDRRALVRPWPAQLNRLIWEGGHDLILSIGQVVPHEVMGMANYNKNIFVGCGGVKGINESHFIGAAYGMERMMGRADTPLRRILNYAQDNFCQHLPLVYVLTVIGPRDDGSLAVRGLYIGGDVECFEAASELSVKVNFTRARRGAGEMVVYLDPEEFHSTWLGNKSVYRTRMAIADGGELIVLAPGVKTFGEDRDDRRPDPQVWLRRNAASDATRRGDTRTCRRIFPPPRT